MKLKFAAVLIMGLFLLSRWIPVDPCDNEIERQIPSPDGKLKVVIFSRNCGATTNLNTQVSLIPNSGNLPDEAGNIFIADQTNLEIKWISANRLKIISHRKTAVFNQKNFKEGVFIDYTDSK